MSLQTLGRLLAFLLLGLSARAAEWQWSVPVKAVTSSETGDHPRAFLWIPPTCKQLRGVVIAQHNLEEESILEHPKFRATLGEIGFAEIWVSPAFDLFFRFDHGAGDAFNEIVASLAEVSGYEELKRVPVVPMGHSAAASFPWNFAAWAPQRTLAVLSVSGQWPYFKDSNTPEWGERTVDGIPGLVTMGEYESAESRSGEGLSQRKKHPLTPLGMLADPGGGHFEASEEKITYLGLYLKKAVQHRMVTASSETATKLKPIDPTREGWLVERWHRNEGPKAEAAPVTEFRGDPANAFWCFDGELAAATEAHQARFRGRKVQLLGYSQNGGIVEQNPKTHQQVTLAFQPIDDGMTFKLQGHFLDTVPEGRPEGWTGLQKGSAIGHAADESPISIERLCGPVERVGPDTWAIRFYRMGMINQKRSNEIWFAATHPGDETYRRSVQQAVLHFPLKNAQGADQSIDFPAIPDQPSDATTLPLKAISSAEVPVHFYVREGPAEIDGNTLRFTQIPPRAKFPVAVTLVAWQWGRSIDPKLKTAEPVERTFHLIR